MSKSKGGKIKPVKVKMTCSEVGYKTIEVKPAIKEDKKKFIKAEDAVMKRIVDPERPCQAERVAGFGAHLTRVHHKCKAKPKGTWQNV